jgi:hypothetical protein
MRKAMAREASIMEKTSPNGGSAGKVNALRTGNVADVIKPNTIEFIPIYESVISCTSD